MGVLGKIFGKEDQKQQENLVIASPLKGQLLPLSEVKDEVFSSGTLGKGAAVEPDEGKAVAPVDGEIVSLFPTKHAIGMRSADGVEILIHIGLDTVELGGTYFEAHVEQGQMVKQGQVLVTFELEKIREAGYVTQVPIILTNLGEYSEMILASERHISYGENMLILS